MSEGGKFSSVRYVKFSGKGSEFNEWKVKTLALARRKGFAKYLKEDLQYSTDDAVKKSFENGNADAWDQLVLSLSGTPFDLIQEADENAYEAWRVLLNKYEVSGENRKASRM